MSAPIDLDAIRARATAATPGPWMTHRVEPLRDSGGWGRYEAVAGTDKSCGVWRLRDGGRSPSADANFIAHARTDVPALIAKVEALRAAVERVRDACAQVINDAESGLSADVDEMFPIYHTRLNVTKIVLAALDEKGQDHA